MFFIRFPGKIKNDVLNSYKRTSNSCQTKIKLVKNATQNYALKRDLNINACLTWKYTKELNSFLILHKIR
jgi:hypothetical protein